MEHMDWNTVAQAVILAISTWYIRRGGKKDREEVKKTTKIVTAAQTEEIVHRINLLEKDFSRMKIDVEFLKDVVLKDGPENTGLKEGYSQ